MSRSAWTFAVTSVALFMVVLDNLVVTTALPSIRTDLGGSLEDLQWTVNAYTLSFAVLLMTGAALGDRFGRRRMFLVGLGTFTVASALAALAPSAGALIAARALQGMGAAIVTPLTLTLLSEAFPPGKRGLVIGLWSGISGLGVALGPLIGGAVVDGISWHWIFWINVPIGLALLPLAHARLSESHGPADRLDLPGLVLAGVGLLGVVFGIVRGETLGWTSSTVVGSIALGVVALVAFVAWELRAPAPMLPMRFFRSRAFAASNGVSLAMYFGVFGSIFLLAQFFQVAQHLSPLEAGLRTLPWTAMPMLVAPIAGLLSDKIGSRPLMFTGLALQAVAIGWIAAVSEPTAAYITFVAPFILAGTGMALVFAPTANAVLAAVRPEEAGQASGATNAIREVGGALGVAVLASVFAASGSYASPQAFVDGMTSAAWVGAAVLAVGALLALLVPGKRRVTQESGEPVLVVAAS
ncbi:DHA2 family efflux MFS transporter permease subunit [Solirubrobacter phytolaccae]|uniref:DHA2 family efflux MFS transporter permease subunit n=1 Tax=Solirubrobacter phytolaccae TaxID=1404360 RepID=A0A9X3N9K7_9ACTN|nr:DHA2 family efflux MFS transporter permease subunit [Solirubrobacter phytolaccae]MDA0180802.1 DHA2 family efflux MFS transporter permease subunit [Solirubrobacter phytolaccae]